MMDADELEVRLYLLNAAVLFAHEVDSAYWREWELFGIPGGVQVFVVLNLGLFLGFLFGFRALIDGERIGHGFSLGLAGAGLLAVVVHGAFLLAGRPGFDLPVSLALLGATFVISVPQGWLALAALRR